MLATGIGLQVYLSLPPTQQVWILLGFVAYCHNATHSNYTLKITIFVNMWNLGQFGEKLVFCQ